MNISAEMQTVFYIVQIVLLLLCIPFLGICIFMVVESRAALNGLARGLIALLSLLIALSILISIRRIDDAFGILNSTTTLILSSIVALVFISIVMLVTIDLHYLYKNRGLYTWWKRNQQERINEYEAMREKSERIGSMWSN